MGCGSSSAAGAVRSEPIRVQPTTGGSGTKLPPSGLAAAAPKKLPPIKSEQKPPAQQNGVAQETAIDDEKQGKGGVAYSIAVGSNGEAGQADASTNDIDKILHKPLPPRLRHLEPLENVPSINPEQLAEKLRKAEEKRARMLEKRRNSNVTKQSKARREMLKAQEFSDKSAAAGDGETTITAAAAAGLESLQQKQASAEQKRQAQLAAVQEKQRVRAERARTARERAKRLKEEMEAELQIEKDDGGGDSDSDASWLGEEGAGKQKQKAMRTAAALPDIAAPTGGGSEQQQQQQQQQRDSSGYSSRDASSASAGQPSELGSRATTGKTVSTVLEDDRGYDFFD